MERNAWVGKDEILTILKELSYYRPKQEAHREWQRKRAGKMHDHEIEDDIISVRHKELIADSASSFSTVPGNMANFVFQNMTKGFFKNIFTQFDEN